MFLPVTTADDLLHQCLKTLQFVQDLPKWQALELQMRMAGMDEHTWVGDALKKLKAELAS